MSAKRSTYRTNGHAHPLFSHLTMDDRVVSGTRSSADTVEPLHENQLFAILPAMLFTSRPDGQWDYVNPKFCAYTNLQEEALMGLGWAETLHASDRVASPCG